MSTTRKPNPPPEFARVISIDALTEDLVGSKVRMAGRSVRSHEQSSNLCFSSIPIQPQRVLAFKPESQLLLLASRRKAIWVNASIVIDLTSSTMPSYIRESDSVIMVMGNLDFSEVIYPFQSSCSFSLCLTIFGVLQTPHSDFSTKSAKLPTKVVHKHLTLEAIILKPADGLDLDDWEETVALREASFARAREIETANKTPTTAA